MLDLDTRVHLQEVELPPLRVQEELDGADVVVADVPAEVDGRLSQGSPQPRFDARRRSLLHELLLVPLHRAVSVAEVDGLAATAARDLHLDVPSPAHPPLEKDAAVPERRLRLGPGHGQLGSELVVVVDDAHPRAATPLVAFSMSG